MMGTALLTALETVLAWIVHASWQAAILGLLLFLVLAVLRGRLEARWRFCLWLAVLARLALPVTPSAPWSLFHLAPRMHAEPTAGGPVGDSVAESMPTSDLRAIADRAAA